MTRINTNISSLNAQQTLANSTSQLQTSLTQLSTGLRINSGADDPAGLIASEALNGDILNTRQAVTNSQQASQMISTADSALGQVSSLLDTIKGLVNQAASSGTMSAAQISANQLQIDSALDAINRISQTTTFQGKSLLNGNLAFTTAPANDSTGTNFTSDVASLQINQANLGSTNNMSVAVHVGTAAAKATLTSAVSGQVVTTAAPAAVTLTTHDGKHMTITAPNGSAYNGMTVVIGAPTSTATPSAVYNAGTNTLTIKPGDTTDLSGSTLNTLLGTTTNTAGGTLAFTAATTDGSVIDHTGNDTGDTGTMNNNGADLTNGLSNAVSFQVTGAAGSQVFSFTADTTSAQMANTINLYTDATGVSASGANNTLTLTSSNYGSAASVKVDILSGALDANFQNTHSVTTNNSTGVDIGGTVNGVTATGSGTTLSVDTSALSMDMTLAAGTAQNTNLGFSITGGGAVFQIGPTVGTTQQARMGIQSFSTGELVGVDGRLSDLGSGGTASLATSPTKAAQIVNEISDQVTSLRGRLGAFQQSTLDSNINSLNDAVQNLTSAKSSIEDTDFATASAALTRDQVLVQSGTAVLSIANHIPDNVLALLKQ